VTSAETSRHFWLLSLHPVADVTLNTHPPTHTPNMFSWFPIYFPLKEPLQLPPGAPVVAHMWRKCGAHKVWYEWAVSEPSATHIHNTGGRSYYVGL
jgi:protein arginine N-methyltransferase 5